MTTLTEETEFKTPGGNLVSYAKGQPIPTAADLEEMDRNIAADNAQLAELEFDEDPDADGYGWERKALRGVW